jgi:D-alanyl-D-alanine carboxypeptidase
MRVFLPSAVLLLAITGCGGSSVIDPERPFDSATVARLEAAVAQVMADKETPGIVVGVYYPGRGQWETAVGVSDLVTERPMAVGNHFRIGSVTKTFIGTLILQLAGEGRISLDQKVGTILDGIPNGDRITIRQLLNMTSGLPSYTMNEAFVKQYFADTSRSYTAADLLRFAWYKEPVEPGTQLFYSNTNTVVLGQVIEKVTGKSIATNLRDRIFARLGLTGTSWPQTPAMPEPFSHGYSDDVGDSVMDASNWNPSWTNAAGQMISALRDLRVYARALGRGDLVTPQMQAERLRWVELPGPPDKKYGLAIGKTGGWIFHQGELPGYNSVIAYLPEMDAVIVVLVNTSINPSGPTPVMDALKRISDLLSPAYSPPSVQ